MRPKKGSILRFLQVNVCLSAQAKKPTLQTTTVTFSPQQAATMSEPQQMREQKEAVGGRNDEPQDVSAIDTSAIGGNILNPMGGGLAEPAVDEAPGKRGIPDIPGDQEHLSKLSGDVGAVKGTGLGVVQGGVDERGGTGAPSVAHQTDTGKLEGSDADISNTPAQA